MRLAQRRGQARFLWFDKQPVDGTGFGTLDEALWKPLLSAEGAVDPELALDKMGLLTEDHNGTVRATVAGILLCCSSPEDWLPNACIAATPVTGGDRASGQLDAQVIGGPLDKQIREALAFTVRNLRVAARKEPAPRPAPVQREGAVRGPGQCRCPSRLLYSGKQNQARHVRGQIGALFAGRAAQQSHGGQHR